MKKECLDKLAFTNNGIILILQKTVISDKYYTQTKLDTLAALVMAESAVDATPSSDTISVARIALDICKNRVFK